MKSWFVLAPLAVASTASAGTLADALAKADKGAIATLREQKTDIAARCTLGAVYAKRDDLPRAQLYFQGCGDAELPGDISAAVAKASREVTQKLSRSDFSSVVVTAKQDGVLSVEISAMPGDTFTTPATIWVKAGTYELVAHDGEATYKQTVTVGTFSRTSALIDNEPKKAAAPKAGNVSFDDGGSLEQSSGPPPPVKRGSLMSRKYQGVVEPVAVENQLEDPMLHVHARAPRAPRTLWLGARLGGGMFDDGASDARAGAALAATGRYVLSPRYFLAARLDWSRRGGAAIDVVGASAGAGATLADGAIGVALIAQLRGDLRIGDEMAETFGASAAANLELTLPSTPITAGVRFEQGLTELAPSVRDRALLVEVGVDWR